MSKKICIIPARGGSKRIPRKNINNFLGKPIIAYSIELAVKSKLFDEIIVSTDDDEIAEVSIDYGAKVPFRRSNKNSDDFATTADVILEVLNNYREWGIHFEYGCCIYPTAPLTKYESLKKGLNLILKNDYSTVLPVTAFTYPIWRSLKRNKNNLTNFVWSEHQNSRSQDLEETFHDAGQWYWFRSDSMFENNSLYTSKTGSIVLDSLETQDIDNYSDWKLAELKYELLQGIK